MSNDNNDLTANEAELTTVIENITAVSESRRKRIAALEANEAQLLAALRHVVTHGVSPGGQDNYNYEHLMQIINETERLQKN